MQVVVFSQWPSPLLIARHYHSSISEKACGSFCLELGQHGYHLSDFSPDFGRYRNFICDMELNSPCRPCNSPSRRRAILFARILCKVTFHTDACLTCTELTNYSCHANGSLTLLFMPIARHSQNILSSLTHSTSISITSEHPNAGLPRVALMGTVTVFHEVENTPNVDAIESCYLSKHPDARRWCPGPKAPHIVSVHRFYQL